jgi:hypothetical protein
MNVARFGPIQSIDAVEAAVRRTDETIGEQPPLALLTTSCNARASAGRRSNWTAADLDDDWPGRMATVGAGRARVELRHGLDAVWPYKLFDRSDAVGDDFPAVVRPRVPAASRVLPELVRRQSMTVVQMLAVRCVWAGIGEVAMSRGLPGRRNT